MILLSFIITYAGFILLSLAMQRHYSQLKPKQKKPSRQQVFILRFIGSVCLITACTLCIVSDGVGVGLAYWTGLLTFSAVLLSLLLSYRPQWIFFWQSQ